MERLFSAQGAPADLLIAGARVVDPASGLDGDALDVRIHEGVIAEIGPSLDRTDLETIEGDGLVLLPGLVDPHVHLRTPGDEDEEDVASGTRAAAAGGFTAILAMPNTSPVVDTPVVLAGLVEQARREACVPTGFMAAITAGQEGERIAEMCALADAGAAGFSDDGRPVERAAILRRAFQYASVTGLRLALHEEDLSLSGGAQMHEGAVSAELGLEGYPSIAESVMVGRDLAIARYESAPRPHLPRLGGRVGGRDPARARAWSGCHRRGIPHHLCLTDEHVRSLDAARAKMSPPLRSATDRAALIEALADGTIDCIATDHAPHRGHEKEQPFEQAPNGVDRPRDRVLGRVHAPRRARSRPALDRRRPDVRRPCRRVRPAAARGPGGDGGQPQPLGPRRELARPATVRVAVDELRLRRADAPGPLPRHDRGRVGRPPPDRGSRLMPAFLVLEDGTVYRGRPYAAHGIAVGELVFTTSMTGYQEVVTDPSFSGQLITFTQPMIGNYGVEPDGVGVGRPACPCRDRPRGPKRRTGRPDGVRRLAGRTGRGRPSGDRHPRDHAPAARRRRGARRGLDRDGHR